MEIKLAAKEAATTYAEWDKALQISREGEYIRVGSLHVYPGDLLNAVQALCGSAAPKGN